MKREGQGERNWEGGGGSEQYDKGQCRVLGTTTETEKRETYTREETCTWEPENQVSYAAGLNKILDLTSHVSK